MNLGGRPLDLVKFLKLGPPHILWEQFFGPYPWFYAPFIGDYVGAHGLRVTELFSQNRPGVGALIPERWKSQSSWGQWSNISQVQFRAALSQRLVRLDKAILSILLVGILSEADEDEEVSYDGMRSLIIPSTFVLDGVGQLFKSKKFVDRLVDETGQRRLVFDELAQGFAIVEYISDEIVTVCRKLGEDRVDMRLLKDRTDGTSRQLIRPISVQTLDSKKIIQYYNTTRKQYSLIGG